MASPTLTGWRSSGPYEQSSKCPRPLSGSLLVFYGSSAGVGLGVCKLASHSLISVDAVLVRFPGESFVSTGQGSWSKLGRGISSFGALRGVVSERL